MFIAFIILTIGTDKVLQYHYYNQNKGWQAYDELFYWRESLHALEMEHYDQNKDVYDSIGWSKNDYNMFRVWMFHDENVFSTQKIQKAAQGIRAKAYRISNIGNFILPTIAGIFLQIHYVLYAGLLWLILKNTIKKREKLLIFITVILALAFTTYFSYMRVVPSRFIVPIIFYIGLLCFYYSTKTLKDVTVNYKNLLIPIMAAVIVFLLFNTLIFENILNKTRIKTYSSLLSQFPKDNMIFGFGLRYEWILNYKNMNNQEYPYFLLGGWTIRSPNYYKILKKNNIDNIYKDLYTKKTITYIAPKYYADLLHTFIKEHYKKDVHFQVIKKYNQLYYELYQYKLSD